MSETKEKYEYALAMVDVYESEIKGMEDEIKRLKIVIDSYESENPDEI